MSPRNRLSDSVWTAFTEGLRFIIVPIVLLDLITKNYPLLSTPFMPQIKEYILFFGGMIVAASTFEAMNKPGTFKRLLFGLSALGFVCMWIFVIFGGGIAEFTYGPYHFRFDITKIVYVMLIGISLKGLLIVNTYSSARTTFKEEERRKRLEKDLARREVARAKHAARVRSTKPEFSSLRRVAFEVTQDDSVGYEPPPPPPPPAPVPQPATVSPAKAVKFKVCPICGEKALTSETVCKNCGAWFAKESFRFEKTS